jgi:SHS2 domain-containing protein
VTVAYEYFEHQADVGIVGRGRSLEEAFAEAAKAMFNLMVDIEAVRPIKVIEVECEAENEEELFVEWLNALLAEASINNMVLSQFDVRIEKGKLVGLARGEELNPARHEVRTEVKAATYSQLKIIKDGEFVAQCVVDV